MTIKFSCPKCGKRFAVKDESGGKRGKCPCGAEIIIPPNSISASKEIKNNTPEHNLITNSNKQTYATSHGKNLKNKKFNTKWLNVVIVSGILLGVVLATLVTPESLRNRLSDRVGEWIYAFLTTNVTVKIILLIVNIPIYFLLGTLIFSTFKNFWRLEKYGYIPIYYLLLSRRARNMARRDYSSGYFSLKRILLHMLHIWLFIALYLVQYMLIKVVFLN